MTETEKTWVDRHHVCEHEAAHAVVAQKMGLPVAWVTVDPGCDEGINFDAAVKIPEELIDRERDLLAICVSMAAPSHFATHFERPIGHYARLELEIALAVAGRAGIGADTVYDTSSDLFNEHYVEILDLAQRLYEEGTVSFTEVTV